MEYMSEFDLGFESLYRRWYPRMKLFAETFRALRPEEREDLAHDILVHAWLRRENYAPERAFSPWLYRVASNYAIDFLRRRPKTLRFGGEREQGRLFAAEPADPAPGPGEELADRELLRNVGEAIRRLGEGDQRIALLVFYEGLSSREAGKILSLSGGTVRWRIHCIRAELRRSCGIEEAGL